MYRIVPIIFMLLFENGFAGLSIKNDKDRSIFEDSVVLSSQILAKNFFTWDNKIFMENPI